MATSNVETDKARLVGKGKEVIEEEKEMGDMGIFE